MYVLPADVSANAASYQNLALISCTLVARICGPAYRVQVTLCIPDH